ncbi:MAG: hypothetical protein HFF69_07055 [Oscillospiraceae bacterium]|jgi:hypothetical protein|nr:hypothetical protein [Oscillospiraceae bacterium]
MTLARMAVSYRHSARLLWERIKELKKAEETAGPAEKSRLGQRIKDLNTLYRETQETARFLERYYDGRCRRRGRR